MSDLALLSILFAAIIILCTLRYRDARTSSNIIKEYQIGSAMTIGNREVQQDCFGSKINKDSVLMVLADGIRQDGHIAAKLAVDTFENLFTDVHSIDKPQYFFKRAANAANHKIISVLEERQGETSIAAVIVRNDNLFYTLVGNCCIAVFRNDDLIPVSEGQTIDVLARHRYDEGKISKHTTLALLEEHRRYNVLGQDTFQDIELFSKPLKLQKDDVIVMMTDGVFNVLRWIEIEEILSQKGTPQQFADRIIEAVNKSEFIDKDNASIIIFRYG